MKTEVTQDVAALADQFIELANKLCDEAKTAEVGMALAFAAARFEAYMVASMGDDLESFKNDRVTGHEYFTRQFHAFLRDNLDEYEAKKIEKLKYAKFVKEKTD